MTIFVPENNSTPVHQRPNLTNIRVEINLFHGAKDTLCERIQINYVQPGSQTNITSIEVRSVNPNKHLLFAGRSAMNDDRSKHVARKLRLLGERRYSKTLTVGA